MMSGSLKKQLLYLNLMFNCYSRSFVLVTRTKSLPNERKAPSGLFISISCLNWINLDGCLLTLDKCSSLFAFNENRPKKRNKTLSLLGIL